jgi:hypothetical protein
MQRIAYFLGALAALQLSLPSNAFSESGKVKVESPYIYKKNKKGKKVLALRSYRERRQRWGFRLSVIAGGGFETSNTRQLESSSTPLQVDLGINRNFTHFSVGPEVGYYTTKIGFKCPSFEQKGNISLSGLTAGLGLYLDGITENAYLVPFASFGVLLTNADVSEENNDCQEAVDLKKYAPYYRAGVLIGLNWLDRLLTGRAYKEYGLQNSFIYVAMRQISSTSDVEADDLGTEPYLEYGLQLEF